MLLHGLAATQEVAARIEYRVRPLAVGLRALAHVDQLTPLLSELPTLLTMQTYVAYTELPRDVSKLPSSVCFPSGALPIAYPISSLSLDHHRRLRQSTPIQPSKRQPLYRRSGPRSLRQQPRSLLPAEPS